MSDLSGFRFNMHDFNMHSQHLAPLEALIPEMFDEVTLGLELYEIYHLSLCSKTLLARTEPILYKTSSAVNQALHWACIRDYPGVVHRAIRYGLDLNSDTGVNALCLAAKKESLMTFEVLVLLGARLDAKHTESAARFKSNGRFRQLARLSRQLCNPGNTELLKFYFDNRLHDQVLRAGRGRHVAIPCLNTAIRRGASTKHVELLLKHGANPNKVLQFGMHDYTSPLSTAIMKGSEPIFHLLLQYGARINGVAFGSKYPPGPQYALHIPIRAAAWKLVDDAEAGMAFVRLCLKHGADINQKNLTSYCHRTPIFVFLDRQADCVRGSPTAPSPIAKLKFLLKMGASLAEPWLPTIRTFFWIPSFGVFEYPHPLMRVLTKKWTQKRVDDNNMSSVLHFLSENGATGMSLDEMLQFFYKDFCYMPYPPDSRDPGIHTRSKEVQRAITAKAVKIFVHISPKANLGEALRKFVVRERHEMVDRRCNALNAVSHTIIEELITAGADVNARHEDMEDGPSMLHWLCDHYSNYRSSCNSIHYGSSVRHLVKFLLERGADPHLLCKGKTACEHVLADERNGFTKKKHCGALAGMARGVHCNEHVLRSDSRPEDDYHDCGFIEALDQWGVES